MHTPEFAVSDLINLSLFITVCLLEINLSTKKCLPKTRSVVQHI